MNKQIDIILCCYQAEKTIVKALQSIYAQLMDASYQLHVIVADDCSKDNTLSLIKEIDVPNSNLTVEYLPNSHNLGMVKNYQRAFKACAGEYVFILEGDDWWSSPYHVRQHVDYLQTHNDISMSMNRITHYYELTGSYSSSWEPLWGGVKLFNIHEQIRYNVLGNLSACCFRGTYIRQLPDKLFELSFADYLLGSIMAEYGDIAILEESTSVWRHREDSQWGSLNGRQRRKGIKSMCSKYDEYFAYKYKEDFAIFAKRSKISLGLTSWKDFVPKVVRRVGLLLLGKL